jgi:5-methylthioadenosine/S-adenosylhomocysteine deaminase
MSRTLIRNATLVSMDPEIGNPSATDILIEGGKIAAVGKNLSADGAAVIDGRDSIVTPGMVNAHIHTWEFPLRGIGAGWVSSRDYHGNMHQNLATRYNARDVYIANLIGALNQIHHGTTTIMDWCHILKDAEMTEAAGDAGCNPLLQDSVSARGNPQAACRPFRIRRPPGHAGDGDTRPRLGRVRRRSA